MGHLRPLLLFLAFGDSDPISSPLSSSQACKSQGFCCLAAKIIIKVGAQPRPVASCHISEAPIRALTGTRAYLPSLLNNKPYTSTVLATSQSPGLAAVPFHLPAALGGRGPGKAGLVILRGGQPGSQNGFPEQDAIVWTDTLGKHWNECSQTHSPRL